MTSAELDRFRQRLEQERADLQQRIAALRAEFGEVAADTDEPADEGDTAQEIISMQESQTQIDLLRTTLAQIDKALARIAEGTYGVSEVSGKAIPVERLEALPYATTLVDEAAPTG